MATNPTLLTQPIAANGAKNVIPNTTSTVGAMSQDQGFPAETALPLGAGGVAPSREDFNGAFNLLSGIAFMAQKGWQFEFDELQAYYAGCVVRDTDEKLYTAINDVPASSTHPANDPTNWRIYDLSAYTKTINAPMFNKRDVIATSRTYTAPVTGWYKLTLKGGGGGGTGGYRGNTWIQGGSGGGEGGMSFAYEHMTVGDAATVTIGAGGAGGTANYGGGVNGGTTTVIINGRTYTAGGGGGASSFGGSGDVVGATGSPIQWYYSPSGTIAGGNGGGNGGAVSSMNGVPSNATLGGGGAGGGVNNSQGTSYAGSAGGNGYVWFEYFDSSLNP